MSRQGLLGTALVFLAVTIISCSSHDDKKELYKEYPVPGEAAAFQGMAQRINEIQTQLAQGSSLKRGFHAKHHGCLKGEFRVLPERPEDTKLAVFQKAKGYPAWVRFSNGVGFVQADKKLDVRGMAIKLLGVDGQKILEAEKNAQTQDFLMTNNPTQLTKDAQSFIEFTEASLEFTKAPVKGIFPLFGFLAVHPKTFWLIVTRVSRTIPSVLSEQYWSDAPFKLGPKAIKYSARPCADFHKKLPHELSDSYLSQDLEGRAKEKDICFDFLVQFQTDPDKMPIEDASVEWAESDSPFFRVAQLVLPKQVFNSDAQNNFCENLVFTPWHSLPDLRPLGNMNRARKVIYEASQAHRRSEKPVREPDGTEIFQ